MTVLEGRGDPGRVDDMRDANSAYDRLTRGRLRAARVVRVRQITKYVTHRLGHRYEVECTLTRDEYMAGEGDEVAVRTRFDDAE